MEPGPQNDYVEQSTPPTPPHPAQSMQECVVREKSTCDRLSHWLSGAVCYSSKPSLADTNFLHKLEGEQCVSQAHSEFLRPLFPDCLFPIHLPCALTAQTVGREREQDHCWGRGRDEHLCRLRLELKQQKGNRAEHLGIVSPWGKRQWSSSGDIVRCS